MLKFLRNTTMVLWLLISLSLFTISVSIWAASQAMRVAQMSKTVATQAIKNRNQILRLKAKARLRRTVAAVPLLGVGAVVLFEEQDRREWLEANPGKTNADYACAIGGITAEIMDEFIAELPEKLQRVRLPIPECGQKTG